MRSYKFFLSCITAILISFVHVSISYAHGDFTVLTSESFDRTWQKGKNIKKHGSLEAPKHYGLEMRQGSGGANQVVLVTPYTATLYISSTEDMRLLRIPDEFKAYLLDNQDILWVATTWDNNTVRNSSGNVKHFALIKNGKRIYPKYQIPQILSDLLPASNCASYFGFDREQVLNGPYEVRYVNTQGDLITFEVTTEQIQKMIEDEKNFNA